MPPETAPSAPPRPRLPHDLCTPPPHRAGPAGTRVRDRPMTAADHLDAVIVGGGPRGVATALRTAARVTTAGTSPVRLAIIDALAVGSGATWLIDQPAQYLNNTQADATTVHPDDSTPMTGPDAPGPDLVDWA